MTDDAAPSLVEIMAMFPGAELILPDMRHAWPACPTCGRQTEPRPDGRVRLCYVCTCDEIGASAYDLAVCWAHRISLKRWRTYESESDLPSVTRKVWRDRTGK